MIRFLPLKLTAKKNIAVTRTGGKKGTDLTLPGDGERAERVMTPGVRGQGSVL